MTNRAREVAEHIDGATIRHTLAYGSDSLAQCHIGGYTVWLDYEAEFDHLGIRVQVFRGAPLEAHRIMYLDGLHDDAIPTLVLAAINHDKENPND